jgi:hypothetical protein
VNDNSQRSNRGLNALQCRHNRRVIHTHSMPAGTDKNACKSTAAWNPI